MGRRRWNYTCETSVGPESNHQDTKKRRKSTTKTPRWVPPTFSTAESAEDAEFLENILRSLRPLRFKRWSPPRQLVYETCLCHELKKRGLAYRRQVVVPVIYDGLTFDEGLRLDILVEERVICEIKAANAMAPIFQAQVLTYLKLSGRRLGLLLNFNVPRIKDGIQRIVL